MDDLISRQDAIEKLNAGFLTQDSDVECVEECNAMLDFAISEIKELPSAQPERKTGRWRRRLVDSGFNADWHCSECGWKTSIEEHGYNFCPNCGADMRGGEK